MRKYKKGFMIQSLKDFEEWTGRQHNFVFWKGKLASPGWVRKQQYYMINNAVSHGCIVEAVIDAGASDAPA